MTRLRVSVLVQTKNEAVGIEACMQGVRDFDEVIVVDSNSEDSTAILAERAGARVINFSWNGKYPKKKQWQLENVKTQHDWILFLDADEYPTREFLDAIPALLAEAGRGNIRAFDLQLNYSFDGRVLRHGHRVVKRALVHRDFVQFPAVEDLDAPGMGELEGHYQPVVQGGIRRVKNALLHDDKDPIRTWFQRHNNYSDWEASLRTRPEARKGIARLRSRQGSVFDLVPGKSLAFFIYSYLLRRGFLDGLPGLNYAVALSFYYWQINMKTRELRRGTAGNV